MDFLESQQQQPGNDIELLVQACMNEKNAPDLLFHRDDLVSRLQAGLDTQVHTHWSARICVLI